ncbi:MAG: DUF4832 domain-containing protein [Acutalibacteraceae bacterium]
MKKGVRIFICLLILSLLAGCGGNKPAEKTSTKEEIQVVKFKDNDKLLKNPQMGLQSCFMLDEVLVYDIPVGFDSIYIMVPWEQIEPEEGKFNWEKIDAATKKCKEADVSIEMVFFLQASDVYNFTGLPEWLWTDYNIPYQTVTDVFDSVWRGEVITKHPLYYNKVYQEKVKNYLEAIAARYPDKTWDVLDICVYGLYGEWDAEWNPFDWGGDRELKQKTLNELLQIYLDAFKDYKTTRLCVPIPYKLSNDAESADYLKEIAFDKAIENNLMFRSCGIGANDLSGFTKYVSDRSFPNSPTSAETWYGWKPEEFDIDATLNCFYQWHTNTIQFAFRPGIAEALYVQYNKQLTDAAKRIGYRLLPTTVEVPANIKVGEEFEIVSTWTNSSFGVCYRRYPIKYTLKDKDGNEVWSAVDEGFDQTKLIKGQKYKFTSTIKLPDEFKNSGEYGLYISLIDPDTGKDRIALPIDQPKGTDKDSRQYKICDIQIER